MDPLRTLYGPPTDPLWTPYGPSMDPLWTPYGLIALTLPLVVKKCGSQQSRARVPDLLSVQAGRRKHQCALPRGPRVRNARGRTHAPSLGSRAVVHARPTGPTCVEEVEGGGQGEEGTRCA
jgi:hypothetical protein